MYYVKKYLDGYEYIHILSVLDEGVYADTFFVGMVTSPVPFERTIADLNGCQEITKEVFENKAVSYLLEWLGHEQTK